MASDVPKGGLLLTEAEAYFDEVVKSRRWQGRTTYSTGLEHRDGKYDWNRMALEEALDLGQYLAAQVRRLEEQLVAAKAATRAAQQPSADSETRGFAMGAEAFRESLLRDLAGSVPLELEALIRRKARPSPS